MKISLPKLLSLGLVLEVLLFLVCFVLHPDLKETFQYAARYSGRLSAGVFLYAFYSYSVMFPSPLREDKTVRNWVKLFAVVHIIHFGFLAMNIYLNEIELVPVRLLGGALAYLMIVLAPFVLHRLMTLFQLIYFYYVTIVMIATYIARVKGRFDGAEPYWLHYVMLMVCILCAFFFGMWMWKARNTSEE